MTWETLMNLLSREFRSLRRMPVVSFGFANQPVTDAEELRTEELRYADRLDAIVRDFARTRRWPALDEKERYFLRERIRFAYEYASIAQISAPRPLSIATRPQIYNKHRRIIEWLLIDAWRLSGVLNWLDPLLVMTQSAKTRCTDWQYEVAE